MHREASLKHPGALRKLLDLIQVRRFPVGIAHIAHGCYIGILKCLACRAVPKFVALHALGSLQLAAGALHLYLCIYKIYISICTWLYLYLNLFLHIYLYIYIYIYLCICVVPVIPKHAITSSGLLELLHHVLGPHALLCVYSAIAKGEEQV